MQFVTNMIFKNAYGSPTPPNASHEMLRVDGWAIQLRQIPVYCRVSFAAGHCSCPLLDPARGGNRARLLPGHSFARPPTLPPDSVL